MSASPLPPTSRPEEYPPTGGEHAWAQASRDLRLRLTREVPHDVLRELHHRRPGIHFAVAVRQFALLAVASAVSWRFVNPAIWIPAALVAGWTAFNFTILLHEVVHRAVWSSPRPRAERALGILHAGPLPDLLPRCPPGNRELPSDAAAPDCDRAVGDDPPARRDHGGALTRR